MRCNCKNNFCALRGKILPKRQFEYCQGSSGLPEWKEKWYLALLVDNDPSKAAQIKKEFEESAPQEAKPCSDCSQKLEVVEPNLFQKAINFGQAIIQHAAAGFTEVSEEVYQKRLAICQACPFFKDNKCTKCGCPTQTKLRWSSSQCPDSPPRWLKENS